MGKYYTKNWSDCPLYDKCLDTNKDIITYCDTSCSNPERIICHIKIFNNQSEFLVAVKKLPPKLKERMLLDIVWKCWGKTKNDPSSYKDITIQSYRICEMMLTNKQVTSVNP